MTDTEIHLPQVYLRYWLYAAFDPGSIEFLNGRLFPTTNAGLTRMFLCELSEKHNIDDATFLIEDADHRRQHYHDSDSDFMSVATEIAIASNVSLVR